MSSETTRVFCWGKKSDRLIQDDHHHIIHREITWKIGISQEHNVTLLLGYWKVCVLSVPRILMPKMKVLPGTANILQE
jgi:hypothetical protein